MGSNPTKQTYFNSLFKLIVMIQAIRVEYPKTGYGLFSSFIFDQPSLYELSLDKLAQRHDTFPTPSEEGTKMNPHLFCAFISIPQIHQWIMPEEFEVLIKAGYEVQLLHLTKAIELPHQIVFYKKDIALKQNINSLFLK